MSELPALASEQAPETFTSAQIGIMVQGLTAKQAAWYHAFVTSLNATVAARSAGYKGNNNVLHQIGYKNLHHPKLSPLCADAVRRRHMPEDEMMARLAAQGRSDLSNFIEIVKQPDGQRIGVVNLAQGIESGHALQLRRVKQKTTQTNYSMTGEDDNEFVVSVVEMDTTVEVFDPRNAIITMLRASGKLQAGDVKLPEVNLQQFFTVVRNNIIGRPE